MGSVRGVRRRFPGYGEAELHSFLRGAGAHVTEDGQLKVATNSASRKTAAQSRCYTKKEKDNAEGVELRVGGLLRDVGVVAGAYAHGVMPGEWKSPPDQTS